MEGEVGGAAAGGEGDSNRGGEATRAELDAFELAPFADRRWIGPQAVTRTQTMAAPAASAFMFAAGQAYCSGPPAGRTDCTFPNRQWGSRLTRRRPSERSGLQKLNLSSSKPAPCHHSLIEPDAPPPVPSAGGRRQLYQRYKTTGRGSPGV